MQEMSASVLQQLITPIAIIPACGLLCLSTNARLSGVIARVRALHGELLDVYARPEGEADRAGRVRALRLEGLETQSHRLLARARLMRAEMTLLFVAILFMIVTSFLLGVGTLVEGLERAGVAALGAGLLCVAVAMVIAIYEMARSLENVQYEHGRIEKLVAQTGTQTGAQA